MLLAHAISLVLCGMALGSRNVYLKSNPNLMVECDGIYLLLRNLVPPINDIGNSPGFYHFSDSAVSTRDTVRVITTPDPTRYAPIQAGNYMISMTGPKIDSRFLYLAGQPATTATGQTGTCNLGGFLYNPGTTNCLIDSLNNGSVTDLIIVFQTSFACLIPMNYSCFKIARTVSVVVSGNYREDLEEHPKVVFYNNSLMNTLEAQSVLPRICSVKQERTTWVYNYFKMVKEGYQLNSAGNRRKRSVWDNIKNFFTGVGNFIKNDIIPVAVPILAKVVSNLRKKRQADAPSSEWGDYDNAKGVGSTTMSVNYYTETDGEDYDHLILPMVSPQMVDLPDLNIDDVTMQNNMDMPSATLINDWGKEETILDSNSIDSSEAEYVGTIGDDSIVCIDEDTSQIAISKAGSCFSGGGCTRKTECADDGEMPVWKLSGRAMERIKECANNPVCERFGMSQAIAESEVNETWKSWDYGVLVMFSLSIVFWCLQFFQACGEALLCFATRKITKTVG